MDFDLAYNKATALCARQEYCCFDIKEKLVKWGTDAETIEKVLTCLVNEKFIDENRYAGFYARDKFKFNGWGKRKIFWQLHQKKIPENIIKTAIETINPDEYKNKISDLLKVKSKSIKNKEPIKKKADLIRFVLSRGFELNEVLPLIEKLL